MWRVPNLSQNGIALLISAFCQDRYGSSFLNVSSAALQLFSLQYHWKSCELIQCATTNTAPLAVGAKSVPILSEGTPVQIVTVDECTDPAQN